MMPESEAIVKQRSMRKVAFFCNVSSLERQDLQSEKRLNQKKKIEADTLRFSLGHLRMIRLYIIFFARYQSLLDRSYFVSLLDVILWLRSSYFAIDAE